MRFSPLPIIRGHWRALVDVRTGRADKWARMMLLIPFAIAVVGFWRQWSIGNPAGLLAAIALMAGMLVGAFAQMTTLRLRVEEWAQDHDRDQLHYERDALDETVAHLLMAVLTSVAAAVLLVALMNLTPESGLRPWLTAAAIWATSYVALLLLLVLPRMYFAYTQAVNVRAPLSGYNKGAMTDHYDEDRFNDRRAA